jgi:hypothetical protein
MAEPAMDNPLPAFADLFRVEMWEPIPNCAGRYRLRSREKTRSPSAFVGDGVEIKEFRVPVARDVVLVARLIDGGVISYRRPDGTFQHTLNTAEGFARKLAELGITRDDGEALR